MTGLEDMVVCNLKREILNRREDTQGGIPFKRGVGGPLRLESHFRQASMPS